MLREILSSFKGDGLRAHWNAVSWAHVAVAICFFVYFLWRQWQFSLRPRLDPHRPGELPYWTPFLGHSWGIFNDTAKLIRLGVNYFGHTYIPFSLSVAGEHIYIITSPDDVTAVYKDITSFSWDEYMDRLLCAFGLTESARKISWKKPTPGGSNDNVMRELNPQYKCLVHAVEDVYKIQLLPGRELDALRLRVITELDKLLSPPHLGLCGPSIPWSREGSRVISVKKLCQTVLIEATTRSLFGGLMHQFEPDTNELSAVLIDYSWAYVFNYPGILVPRLARARKRLTAAIRNYVRTSEIERDGEAFAIRRLIQLTSLFGLGEEGQIAMVQMVWWAAVSNTVNSAFWLLAHIVYKPTLLERIVEETQPAFAGGGWDTEYIAKRCPLFESTFFEVLRLIGGAMGVRKIVRDTVISGKLLKAGNTVLIATRELHHSHASWGDTVDVFAPDRFLDQNKLLKSPSLRPFGGGVTYCPGRHIARDEVCGMVALLVNRYHVSLVPGQSFPDVDFTKPTTGISCCLEGQDLLIELRLREAMPSGQMSVHGNIPVFT